MSHPFTGNQLAQADGSGYAYFLAAITSTLKDGENAHVRHLLIAAEGMAEAFELAVKNCIAAANDTRTRLDPHASPFGAYSRESFKGIYDGLAFPFKVEGAGLTGADGTTQLVTGLAPVTLKTFLELTQTGLVPTVYQLLDSTTPATAPVATSKDSLFETAARHVGAGSLAEFQTFMQGKIAAMGKS